MLVPENDGMVLISPFPINLVSFSVNFINLPTTPKSVFSLHKLVFIGDHLKMKLKIFLYRDHESSFD